VHNRLGKASHAMNLVNLAYDRIAPRAERYDLFFAFAACPDDILAVNAVQGWRKRSETAVIWLVEAWLKDLDMWKAHWNVISQFDHVVLTMVPCQDGVRELTGRPTYSLPYGTDALLFSPSTSGLDRPIDVLSIGRRSPNVHRDLLELARQERIFYQYDSIVASRVKNHSEHRQLLASQSKRSKLFIANRGKIGADDETGGQHEFGVRFFDAAAAGAIFAGVFPETSQFRHSFDWEDAGVSLGWDESPLPLLERVAAEPEWLAAASRRSTCESLRRHDWLYRWRSILDIAGLGYSPLMNQRLGDLERRADCFDDGIASQH